MAAAPENEYAPSALDQVTIRGLGGLLCCFPVELSDASIERLRTGLATVVQNAPFLSGQVVEDSTTGWTHVVGPYDVSSDLLSIHDERGKFDYNAWRARRFPVQDISHMWSPPPLDIFPSPVLRATLTRMDGGSTLRILFHHSALDGTGSAHVWAAWAAATRGDALPELSLVPRYPKNDASIETTGNILRHPGYMATAPAGSWPESVTTRFWFPNEKLKALKEAASSPGAVNGAWISSHDALVALLWTHIAPTRRVSVIANIRSRLNPPLPESFIGNAVYAASAPSPSGTLQAAASAVRAAVRAVDAELLSDFLGAVRNLRRVYEAHRMPGGPFLITSWTDQGTLGLEWGIEGFHGEYAMFPASLRPGIAIVLPRRAGGLDVAVGLPREQIDALLASDEFMRYAEWENGYKP